MKAVFRYLYGEAWLGREAVGVRRGWPQPVHPFSCRALDWSLIFRTQWVCRLLRLNKQGGRRLEVWCSSVHSPTPLSGLTVYSVVAVESSLVAVSRYVVDAGGGVL